MAFEPGDAMIKSLFEEGSFDSNVQDWLLTGNEEDGKERDLLKKKINNFEKEI